MEKIKPFDFGTQFADWQYENCMSCKLFNEDLDKTCKHEKELGIALLSDGLISKKTATAIGKYENMGYYFWVCKSIVPSGKKQ